MAHHGRGESGTFCLNFCGATDTLFSGDIPYGFQSQSGQPYSHLAETFVLHL